MPSSCGMLVYKDLTSAVTKMALCGSGGRSWIRCKKCLVSRMYEGNSSASGWIKCVMYLDRLSVGPPQPETIGRNGDDGLCIFGRP